MGFPPFTSRNCINRIRAGDRPLGKGQRAHLLIPLEPPIQYPQISRIHSRCTADHIANTSKQERRFPQGGVPRGAHPTFHAVRGGKQSLSLSTSGQMESRTTLLASPTSKAKNPHQRYHTGRDAQVLRLNCSKRDRCGNRFQPISAP